MYVAGGGNSKALVLLLRRLTVPGLFRLLQGISRFILELSGPLKNFGPKPFRSKPRSFELCTEIDWKLRHTYQNRCIRIASQAQANSRRFRRQGHIE